MGLIGDMGFIIGNSGTPEYGWEITPVIFVQAQDKACALCILLNTHTSSQPHSLCFVERC